MKWKSILLNIDSLLSNFSYQLQVNKQPTIFRTFEICRARHVTKNWKCLSAKIKVVVDLKVLVFPLRTTKNMLLKFNVDNLLNFKTGVFLNFDHMTCLANFNYADYSRKRFGKFPNFNNSVFWNIISFICYIYI